MSTNSSERWAVWFAVEGDGRFLSHHEILRLWARAAARARLPLKFTQGFNPRPKLSLALPRPVGVASRRDLLMVELSRQAAESWAADLARELPPGLRILGLEPLPAGRTLRTKAAAYEMDLEQAELDAVKARLEELGGMQKWQVLRRRPGRPDRLHEIKDLVLGIAVEAARLRFTLSAEQSAAAGPADVLNLLGFDNQDEHERPVARLTQAMARLTRTDLECELSGRTISKEG